jgi:hypothetical protein
MGSCVEALMLLNGERASCACKCWPVHLLEGAYKAHIRRDADFRPFLLNMGKDCHAVDVTVLLSVMRLAVIGCDACA